jgi:Lrp/AsnC family transcriptional regulator for asnA, asnC and gidA
VAIARALRVTETTVRHRIERLLTAGFIRIAAVIDLRKTAYRIDALIWAELDRAALRMTAKLLAALPNVVYVALTAGRFNVLIEALFESEDELIEFIEAKLTRAQDVVRTEMYHVLQTLKITYDWKVPLDASAGRTRHPLAAIDGRPSGTEDRRKANGRAQKENR